MQRTPKLILIASACAVIIGSGIGIFYSWRLTVRPTPATITVDRGEVRKDVTASGTVTAAHDVTLAFELPGTVHTVNAKVGDKVKAGQVLATLGSADLSAQLEQAQAAVAAAEARLASLKSGARPEAVAVQDSAVSAAETSATQARQALAVSLADAQLKADDAVRGKTDVLFIAPTSDLPQLVFFAADTTLTNSIITQRKTLGSALIAWKTTVDAIPADADSAYLESAATDAEGHIDEELAYLDDLASAVDRIDLSSNPTLLQTTVDGYRATISAARTELVAARTALTSGVQALKSADAAVAVAKSARTLATAPATADQIAQQDAAVQQAKAAADAVRVQLSKTVLRSPITGVVSKFDAKVGATATPGVPVATVLSDGAAQVDVYVAETDVAAIESAQGLDHVHATVTLDAFGTGRTFDAMVVSMEPASTTIGGAPSYKVTLAFTKADPAIKPGMTANVSIAVADRKDVLRVPRTAVILKDNSASVVLIKPDGSTEEHNVDIGLVGSDGMVEIVQGLSQGQSIVGFGK